MPTRHYEIMILIHPEVQDRDVKPLVEKYLTVITDAKGTVDNIDVWGRRPLAYEIEKLTEGSYVVVDYKSDSAATDELKRQLGLNEKIIRTLIQVKDDQLLDKLAKNTNNAKIIERNNIVRERSPREDRDERPRRRSNDRNDSKGKRD